MHQFGLAVLRRGKRGWNCRGSQQIYYKIRCGLLPPLSFIVFVAIMKTDLRLC
ncbi:MAG TPA: hypothetical protein VF222_10205 [Nitrososphaeraceae archaeon]